MPDWPIIISLISKPPSKPTLFASPLTHSFAKNILMQSKEEIREQKFLMIEAWQQSGLSQKAWCARESIAYHSFHYWYKKYRAAHREAIKSSGESQRFIPLQVTSPSFNGNSAHLELLLTDGRRVLFYSPVSSDYLKAIIS